MPASLADDRAQGNFDRSDGDRCAATLGATAGVAQLVRAGAL